VYRPVSNSGRKSGRHAICGSTAAVRSSTKLTKRTGWSPRGKRYRTHAPFGSWKTQTFIAGLRCHSLTAPWIVNAPMNRQIFEAYVETQLAPTLSPGDVVILDNVAFHKSQRAEELIRARGAWLLFLPPYSPDLNPNKADQTHRLVTAGKALPNPRSVRLMENPDLYSRPALPQRCPWPNL
jgi:hypothetical protein